MTMNLVTPTKALILPGGIKPIEEKREFRFTDQREWADKVMASLGPLEDIDLHYGLVLVCKYERETIGASGLLLASEQTKLEDKYQSKVGIVLKLGPLAFVSSPTREFGPINIKPGDFCLYRMSDGDDMDIVTLDGNHVRHCKLLFDAEIKAVVSHPDRYW